MQFDINNNKPSLDDIYNNLDKYNDNNNLCLKDFFCIKDKNDMIDKFNTYINQTF